MLKPMTIIQRVQSYAVRNTGITRASAAAAHQIQPRSAATKSVSGTFDA
jgi:hypothetical protein